MPLTHGLEGVKKSPFGKPSLDLGGHGEGVVLKDNPGSLFKVPE